MSYPPLIDPSIAKYSVGWEALARKSYLQMLNEGLSWSSRRVRKQMLTLRVRKLRFKNKQWMLFGNSKRLRRRSKQRP
jgi:hypothetical protein